MDGPGIFFCSEQTHEISARTAFLWIQTCTHGPSDTKYVCYAIDREEISIICNDFYIYVTLGILFFLEKSIDVLKFV
jgi:hypothetical protein